MSEPSPEGQLWGLMRGALAAKALGAAADLGVADALADGPRPVAELAEELAADPDTLHRILRALASDGVFAEGEPGVFRNTRASELLRAGGSGAWREFAHLFGGVFYDATVGLEARPSRSTFAEAFGDDYWTWLGAHPEERAIFDRAMGGGKERSGERLSALDWRGDETVVDVGGGNGALLRELFERVPDIRGIVVDLPETVRDDELGDRIEFVEGSFFESVPAGDVYVLSGILHDWDDERAAAILRTIRTAAPDDARLVVVESVIDPGNEPDGAKWLDLLMLVLADGRERTVTEWRSLLEQTGFVADEIEDGLIRARCR
ncbi:MAG TPA: methyltransferase [Gaiellaceae bacterium]|nr:methyltransferase [Gaiellaceae bacterium]